MKLKQGLKALLLNLLLLQDQKGKLKIHSPFHFTFQIYHNSNLHLWLIVYHLSLMRTLQILVILRCCPLPNRL